MPWQAYRARSIAFSCVPRDDGLRKMTMRAFLLLTFAVLATPAIGQEAVPGRVADSAVGEVGQRQSRDQLETGTLPTARLNGRIQNRVQSRIRNRIDRYYNPTANATSPFQVASDEARTAARSSTPR